MSSSWESPETSREMRSRWSNWNWIALMATHSEPKSSPRQQQYMKGHEALGISIWDYVNYALPMAKTDYIIWRFENFEWGKEENERLWKETVRKVDAHAPPDASQRWRNEFQQATGNSPDAHVEDFDFSTLPQGKIVRNDDGKLVWDATEEGDVTDIPEYDNGYTWEPSPGGSYDWDKDTGLFVVFDLLYKYFDWSYSIFYTLLEDAVGLKDYPNIDKNYNPARNDDAFFNFSSLVAIYYASIAGAGLALRLYRTYSAVKG